MYRNWTMWLLLALVSKVIINIVTAKSKGHIGLLVSSGTHSHDLLMHELGTTLADLNYEITWIQYRTFDFNRTVPSMDSRWNRIVQNCVSWETADFVKKSQENIWVTKIPFDLQKCDFRAVKALMDIYRHHSSCCTRALQNPSFWDELKRQKFDLIILDYILLECSIAMSAFLDAPVIYLSNFPISSSYSEWMNVPSPPSSVPSVLGPLPQTLNFTERMINTLFYVFLALTRRLEFLYTQLMFLSAGVSLVEPIHETESKVLFFGTVAEYITESTRPQTHRMKYFGSPHALLGHASEPLNISKELNISSISPSGVIVMSFGSVTSGKHIPAELIKIFMAVFESLPHTVIWQFGSDLNTKSVSVPPNVHLFDWVPLARLLASPEVHLLVSHGGIRSMLEAIHQGLPVLGIPIQGVQYHDLRRVVEQGVAEMISIPEITEDSLKAKMELMLSNYQRYKHKTEYLSEVIHEYYGDLYQEVRPNTFWVQWAVKHGRQMVESKKFYRYTYNSFIVYYCLDIIGACLVCVLTALLGSVKAVKTVAAYHMNKDFNVKPLNFVRFHQYG